MNLHKLHLPSLSICWKFIDCCCHVVVFGFVAGILTNDFFLFDVSSSTDDGICCRLDCVTSPSVVSFSLECVTLRCVTLSMLTVKLQFKHHKHLRKTESQNKPWMASHRCSFFRFSILLLRFQIIVVSYLQSAPCVSN